MLNDVFSRSWFKWMWALQEVGFRRSAVRLQLEKINSALQSCGNAIDGLAKVNLAQRKPCQVPGHLSRVFNSAIRAVVGRYHSERRERRPESWTKSLCDTIDYRGSREASDSHEMTLKR